MTLSIAQKQNYLYLGLIILMIVVAVLSYRVFQKKWLFFREAEKKYQEQQFKESIDFYQKSLSNGPVSSIAYLHLADAYVATGNFNEAIKWYYRYLELYPKDSIARQSLARALSWNGNIKESEKEYQILLQEHEKEKKAP